MVSFLHGFILSMKGQTINKPKRNGDTSIKLSPFTKVVPPGASERIISFIHSKTLIILKLCLNKVSLFNTGINLEHTYAIYRFFFFSARLLSVLRGHSVFSSLP